MDSILVALIIAYCQVDGYPHKHKQTNACEEYYVNCVMGQGNGSWNEDNVKYCREHRPDKYVFVTE